MRWLTVFSGAGAADTPWTGRPSLSWPSLLRLPASLPQWPADLAEGHANAKLLASGLARLQGLELDPAEVEMKMIRFRVRAIPAEQLVERLKAQGVLVLAVGPDLIREVTNLMVRAEDIERAVRTISALVGPDVDGHE